MALVPNLAQRSCLKLLFNLASIDSIDIELCSSVLVVAWKSLRMYCSKCLILQVQDQFVRRGSHIAADTVYKLMCIRQESRSWTKNAQDEIACFRISETWRKHAAPWLRYIYVLRKRENSNLRDSVTSPERKRQVTFPSYLSQQISAVVRFRHVSANGFASWYMSL